MIKNEKSRCYLCMHYNRKGLRNSEPNLHGQEVEINPLSYHHFPKANFSKWMQICQLNEEVDLNCRSLMICSKHFIRSDYVDIDVRRHGGHIRLKPNAYPRILVPHVKKVKKELHDDVLPVNSELIVPEEISISQNNGKRKDFASEAVQPNSEKTDFNEISETKPDFIVETNQISEQKPVFVSNSNEWSEKRPVFIIKANEISEDRPVYILEENQFSETKPIYILQENQISDTRQNSGSQVVQNNEKILLESNEENSQVTKKISFGLPRYIGDLSLEHVATTKRALKTIEIVKSTMHKKNKELKSLQQKYRRLLKRNRSLEQLVKQLQQNG